MLSCQSRKTRSAKIIPRLHPPSRTIIPSITSHPSVDSGSQTPSREARPYGELQVHQTGATGLDSYLETVMMPNAVCLS